MFKKIQIKGILLCLGLLSLSLVFTGSSCSSGGTDGGGDSGKEDSFVSTDSSTGTITLAPNTTSLPVGGTTGFFVTVRDVNGAPVDGIRISCDTEAGLALIEPTTGFELTDGFGNMSGVVGCEAPGSFQMACRLPVGGNKRQFETIICSGSVPADFTGFPGAGGGGLGGGVDTTDEEDDDFIVRVNSVNIYDQGDTSTASSSVDTSQVFCDDDMEELEPFFDTKVGFDIVNNSSTLVRLESYTYTVADFDGAGSSYTSGRIFFLGEASVEADGGTTEVFALFIEAVSGAKRYFGRSDSITSTGFKNVTFNLRGVDGTGASVEITARVSINLGTFDNC